MAHPYKPQRPWGEQTRRLPWYVTLLLALVLLLCVLALTKTLWLTCAGSFLVDADEPTQADAIYVFAGGPEERSLKAAELWRQGLAPTVVCTGENVHTVLKMLEMPIPEAEVSARILRSLGVDSAALRTLPQSTSTWEEGMLILKDAKANGYKTILLVSSEMHTRRIQWVMAQVARALPATEALPSYRIIAAPAGYRPHNWWQSEEGLIFVNNEYIKLGYYALKY